MFEARKWLSDHIEAAKEITDATWEVVAGFALLWFLFEERLCGTDANRKILENIAQAFGKGPLTGPMNAAYAFWSNRYCTGRTTNTRFDELFAEPSGKSDTAAILLDPNAAPERRFFAMLMIVYRLRNNLFHGTKEIRNLNDQVEILGTGSRTLAAVMEHFGVN
jgi:hypothetical protein